MDNFVSIGFGDYQVFGVDYIMPWLLSELSALESR